MLAIEITEHAKDRLRERYRATMTDDAWEALARTIERAPRVRVGWMRSGVPLWEGYVTVRNTDSTRVVLPIRYTAHPGAVTIHTVVPGGHRLGILSSTIESRPT